MPRKKTRNKVPQELRDYFSRFRDHEGITSQSIQKWISQWGPTNQELAKKVLRNTRFYSAADIRVMLRQLVGRIYQQFPGVPRKKIVFVPAGDPYSGAAILGRALRDTPGVSKGQVRSFPELLQAVDGEVDAVALIEDFSGTGDTLESWWYTIEPLILPKIPNIVFGLLVLNAKARPKLEQFTAQVISIQELTEANNVISEESTTFEGDEKDLLLVKCQETGCAPKYLRGYGDCGLLQVFKHFCPNNCLPVLWYESAKWRKLFKRRAL